MPAILEPPPSSRRAASPRTQRSISLRRQHWTDRLVRSGYFVGAVLVHLVVFLLVATLVVSRTPRPPQEDPVLHLVPAHRETPPPQSQFSPSASAPSFPTHFEAPPVMVTRAPVSPFVVKLPDPARTLGPAASGSGQSANPMRVLKGLAPRLPGILKAIEDGQHRTLDNIRAADADPTKYEGTFSVYLASYANGDWDCNVVMKDGAIVAGSLPDLISKMREWSHGHMNGHVEPLPLSIGGPDLANRKPPFIFFTGHKDFVLTDSEIENLRSYLQNGGAIWGDNALPGYGSRFDIAFRREMKRVIPDRDKQFQDVTPDSEIFTKSFFRLSDLAAGMNFHAEQMQHLDLDGKIAIFYTPNDYSDLFTMDLLPGNQAMAPTWVAPGGSPLFTSATFLWNSGLFFRNYSQTSALAAQRLGMNILSYLLVRFDSELLLGP